MHALIIEQDIWVIVMIEDVLRSLGYTSFDTAASVEAATLCAELRCPDLVTSDLRLDTGTGVEAIRHICTATAIPAVFITSTPWEIESGQNVAIVAKPFGAASLAKGVAEATQARPLLS
jgi:CheY-like chemotaxis protein